jgi:hypothetical protein
MSTTHQSDRRRLVCRRHPVAPGALAPVSTGWMRDPAGSRVSVNLTVEGDGQTLRAWVQEVSPLGRRARRLLYAGGDLDEAVVALNDRAYLLDLANFRCGPSRPRFTVEQVMSALGFQYEPLAA